MSIFTLVADSGFDSTGSQPIVSSVTVALTNLGSCSGTTTLTAAQITITVACGPVNDTQYTGKLYENGSFVQTLTTAGGTYIKSFAGYVDGSLGGSPFINPSLTYRYDVVRNSDSAVVSSVTSATYTNPNMFGTCGGPP